MENHTKGELATALQLPTTEDHPANFRTADMKRRPICEPIKVQLLPDVADSRALPASDEVDAEAPPVELLVECQCGLQGGSILLGRSLDILGLVGLAAPQVLG